jgi:hypothetical protein
MLVAWGWGAVNVPATRVRSTLAAGRAAC